MGNIEAIFQFLIGIFQNIATLYSGSLILSAVIGLWLFRKVVNYFKYIMP